MTSSPASPEAAARVIRDAGLLLQTHPTGPSVVGLLAGGPVSGSWWSHPHGKAIFAALQVLDDDPDIALFKLLGGKVTFVHRRLWPALAAIGLEQAPWQTGDLDAQARAALAQVEAQGELPADTLTGQNASLLEGRLLVRSRQVHSERGRHVRILSAWSHWLALVGAVPAVSAAESQREIERAAAAVYAPVSKGVSPPWPPVAI